MAFATIDIGTNSVLLLIASPLPSAGEGSGVRVCKDEVRITGLGRGLTTTFHPASRQRTLIALKEYHRLCREAGVKKVICAGTAAFRKAADGPDFMREIGKRFGWRTMILSGEEEARLSYLSVERDFGDKFADLVALDIGGGSTEIISKAKGVSLELGTVVLTEKFIANMEEEIDRLITPPLPPSYLKRGGTLVALAGTATTLSSVNQKLEKWDPGKIQGSVITLPELDAMIELFRSTTHEERKAIPGMVPGREDTILAGALILKAVMIKLGIHFVVVSDRGLRYGLFYQEFSNARIF